MRQALIRENQADEFGLTAGSASRAVPMPNPSLPTLSQATVQATERAILEYEAIVARGGWPELARLGCMRLGMRHPSVADLRRRLAAVRDLHGRGGSPLFGSGGGGARRGVHGRPRAPPDRVRAGASVP